MRGILMTEENASVGSERSRTSRHIVETRRNPAITRLQRRRIGKENRSPAIGVDPVGKGLAITRKLTGPRSPLSIRYPPPRFGVEIKQGHIVIPAFAIRAQ